MRACWSVAVATALVAVGGATAAAAGNPFAVPRGHSLDALSLTASSVSAKRAGSTIQLELRGLSSRGQMALIGRRSARSVAGTGSLPRQWIGLLGFSPTVNLTYSVGGARRTHAFTGGALPSFRSRGRVLRMQFTATQRNLAVLSRMSPSKARSVTARLEPTPAPGRLPAVGRPDPGAGSSKSEMSTSTDPAPFPQPSPNSNASFTLPYTPALGGSGAPWNNYLTATGETTGGCQDYSTTSAGLGGTASTNGTIYVYQTSAQAQQALSIGASVQYKHGLSKAKLSASYSQTDTQSSSSLYAVSVVRFTAGVVSLGAPSLSSQAQAQASQIASIGDALNFMQTCGDSVPVSYGAGATYIAVMRIKLSSASEAQSVSAKLKVSYAGVGASQSFSDDVSSSTSSASIVYQDECWGPSSNCAVIPGYTTITTTDMNQALAQFSSNYSLMLSGLPKSCAPSAATPCVTDVNYRSISGLIPYFNASNYLNQAAYGAFGVSQNLSAWDSEYLALAAGNPSSSSAPSWSANASSLGDQAITCSLGGASGLSGCATQFTNCSNSSQDNHSYLNAQCLPSAFPKPLRSMQDPFVIAGAPEEDLS